MNCKIKNSTFVKVAVGRVIFGSLFEAPDCSSLDIKTVLLYSDKDSGPERQEPSLLGETSERDVEKQGALGARPRILLLSSSHLEK